MNKKISILFVALTALLGLGLMSCDDDKQTDAKAVLASASNLTFDGASPVSQNILVYSDATWHVECPDWIQVEPTTGSGTTDVTVIVTPNMREGALDNPRRANLVFKGLSKASEAIVVVNQTGDAFRDVVPITIAEMDGKADESVVIVKNVTVVAPVATGFVGTDGQNNIYVTTTDAVPEVGTAVTVEGTKWFDANKLSYVEATAITAEGSAATAPEATDITAKLDSYTNNTRAMVTVEGAYDGSNIVVEGQTNVVVVADINTALDLKALGGHKVRVKGLYGGTAAPAVRMIVTEIEDLGLYETIYFMDDFEWLEPWSVASGVGRTVEEDYLDATATALTSIKTMIDGVETSCFDFIESKGYTFVYDKNDNKRIYLQRNYLKFGKTGNHAGITLPSIDAADGKGLYLEFVWCPMRQDSGKIDPVTLFVQVENGSEVKRFDVPVLNWENNHKLEWVNCHIDLSSVVVNKDTKITISQDEFNASTANRWFLDNIKVAGSK